MRNKSQNSRLKRKAEKRKPGEVHILWQFKGHTLRRNLKPNDAVEAECAEKLMKWKRIRSEEVKLRKNSIRGQDWMGKKRIGKVIENPELLWHRKCKETGLCNRICLIKTVVHFLTPSGMMETKDIKKKIYHDILL